MSKVFSKTAFLWCVLVIFALFFTGCGKENKDDGKISIVCTIFPQYDFVRQITEDIDNVEVTMLLKPGQESHDYDPSSKDILSIHNADLFIYVGGESDTWIEDVLTTVENKKQIQLSLMDMVEKYEEEEVGDGAHDHDDEENHSHGEEYDEHVWTSPANAIIITEKISEAVMNIEGIDKEKVKTSTENYINDLKKLDNDIKQVVENSSKKAIVVADRFPLRYFCEEFGIEYYAAFSGCATSVEPSTATLIYLIDKVKELDLKYIFTIEMSSASTAKQVSAETGAEILTFNSCHNVTSDDLKAEVTYIDLMEKNLEALKKALND